MIVTLSRAEQKLAIYLAKARHLNARKQGMPNEKIGPQSNYETDLEGIGSEIAYCRIMNVYPDLDIAAGETPTEDCTLTDGRTVDVKATRYRSGHLLATKKKDQKGCDLYALMIGEFPSYRLAGHATHDELFKEENLKNYGHGETYSLPQDKLTGAY